MQLFMLSLFKKISMRNHKYDAVIVLILLVVIIGSLYFISKQIRNRNAGSALVFSVEIGGNTTVGDVLSATIPATAADQVFTNTDTSSSVFSDMLKDGGINTIHSYAGTTANFTNWTLDGAGVLDSETTRDGQQAEKATEASWTTKYAFRFHDRLVTLLQNSGAEVFPDVNVASQIATNLGRFDQASIDLMKSDNMTYLADLANNGITPVGLRLGAEVYLDGSADVWPSAQDYINRVAPLASAIKSTYPSIPLYTHAVPYDKTAKTGSRIGVWNDTIKTNTDFYNNIDGTTIYSWYRLGDQNCTGSTDQQFSCYNTGSENFVDTVLPAQFDGTTAIFPDKKIAIGQLGVKSAGESYNTANDNIDIISNSMLHAFLITDMYLGGIAKYNAYHNNVISLAAYMNAGGTGKGDTALKNLITGYDKNSKDVENVVQNIDANGNWVKRAGYHGLRMASKNIFDGTHQVIDMTYTLPSNVSGTDFRMYGFLGTGGDRVFVMTNRTNQAVSLEAINVNGKSFSGTGDFTVESVSGSALTSTYGAKPVQNTATFTPIILSGPIGYTTTTGITIAPFSITKIVIPESGDREAPSVPINLHSTGSTNTSVSLLWDSSTDNIGVANYLIYQNGGSAPVATTSDTAYTVSGLTTGTSYTFTIAAEDAFGNISLQSSPFTISSADTTPPSVPTGMSASAITSTSVTLSWNASTDNLPGTITYQISRGGVDTQNGTLATTTATTYTITNLVPDHNYRFTVKAVDISNNASTNSKAAWFKTLK